MPKETTEKTVVTNVGKIETTGEKNAYILFLSGPLVGKLHQLVEGETVLGRASDATLKIDDARISRQHLSIRVGPGGTTITDLGSTNGTYVNGKRIQTHILNDGDKIQISSNTIFKFAYQDNLENVFHKELYKMAVVDALTGVFNKRYFLDRLKEEFSHSRRVKHPLSLILFDVDFFKQVNDTHGHLVGDCALAHIAGIVRGMVRTSDVLARYGGEEFVMMLRNTDRAGGWQMAERIRKKVEGSPVQLESLNIPVTISLGVATLGPLQEFEAPERLIEAADRRLYRSKLEGRNRTTAEDMGGSEKP